MKIRAAIVALAITVTSFVAAPAHAASLAIGVVYDLGGRGDRSYNDAAAAGLALAQKKFTFTVEAVVTDGTTSDREKRIRALAQKGLNPVVVVGSGFAPALQVVSIEFPNTQFAILNDASVPSLNVDSLIFNDKQALFIAGYAAALASKTKKVALIASPNQADIFQDGFTAGVKAANASVKISVAYVNGSAVAATNSLMQSGNDVIVVSRSGSDSDVFDQIVARNVARSKQKNFKQVGMISIEPDQFVTVTPATKKYLLATVVKRVDIAMYDVISHALADNESLDILDPVAGIYGHTYNVTHGIEFRPYSTLLTTQASAISKAAVLAAKIAR